MQCNPDVCVGVRFFNNKVKTAEEAREFLQRRFKCSVELVDVVASEAGVSAVSYRLIWE